MKLLILSIDGRGMGHLNRTTLLARALTSVEPAAEIYFLAESPMFGMIEQVGFDVLKLPDPMHPTGRFALTGRRAQLEADLMAPVLSSLNPDAVMIDFVVDPLLFSLVKECGSKLNLVVRRLKPRAMNELVSDPAQGLVDGFIIPHSASDFGPGELPSQILSRCHFTGDLVRGVQLAEIPAVRREYGRSCKELVLVTLGGGGWSGAADLARCSLQALAELVASRPGLKGMLVCGPLFDGELPEAGPGIDIIRFEARLPELMAAADAVVCSAGYNSTRELKASGTPGVLVPLSNPGRDDQSARAQRCVSEGRALVSAMEGQSIARNLGLILEGNGPGKRAPEAGGDLSSAGRVLRKLLTS